MKYSAPLRRTFEAASHPKGSLERERLNRDALTSEFLPGSRYVVREFVNTPQGFVTHTFRTKADALARFPQDP